MPYQLISDRYFLPNETACLFRYMNESKAIDFLSSSEFYFNRISNFPRYDEVMFSLRDREWIRNNYSHLPITEATIRAEIDIQNYECIKEDGYINCWTENTSESRLLWNEYVGEGNGIAIKSNFRNLKSAISNTRNNINIAKVHYFDPIGERLGLFNGIWMLSRKIADFRFENEVRQIILLSHSENNPRFIRECVDLPLLVQEIIFSRNSTQLFKERILDLVETLNLPMPINSTLTYG